ncbi:MAG: hypothetical protein JXQ71_16425 [Verrucomicrobia bacterium]|nr:hypothetical protein [Verrucomicrobiota bacterium]
MMMTKRQARWARHLVAAGTTLALFSAPHTLSAGDPILFPKNRTHQPYLNARVAPGLPILVPSVAHAKHAIPETLPNAPVAFAGGSGGSLYDYRISNDRSAPAVPRINLRAARQRQEEQANRNAWAFARQEPAKLQDASDLEAKIYTAKDLEQDPEGSDPTFRGLETFKSAGEAEQRWFAENPAAETAGPDASASTGEAIASSPELSLGSMLAPMDATRSARADGASSTSLKELLGSQAQGTQRPGLESLAAPNPTRNALAPFGSRDPILTSPDASRQPMMPLVGTSPRSASPAAKPGQAMPLGALSVSRPPGSPALPPAGGLNRSPSRITPFSTLPPAGFTSPQQSPGWATAGSRDPMRRRF